MLRKKTCRYKLKPPLICFEAVGRRFTKVEATVDVFWGGGMEVDLLLVLPLQLPLTALPLATLCWFPVSSG